jgi:AcrR family transcriptional regulator
VSKAARTREHLRGVALRLFAERGYDQTTVADIAAAAGVTPMTFFRHFAAKERVVIDDPYDPAIAEAVLAQPSHLPVLERVRCGLLAAWGRISADEDAELRGRLEIGASHPALRARMRENNATTEAAIVDALVADGVGRFEASVAAAAVLGALTAALLQWATSQGPSSLGAAVTGALAVLEPGPNR